MFEFYFVCEMILKLLNIIYSVGIECELKTLQAENGIIGLTC
jgi:hypothetical protein